MSSDEYIRKNNSWYKNRIEQADSNIEILSSGTNKRRNTRFQVLTQVGIQKNDSILDIGCGLADFKAYLDEQEIDINYTGVDISSDLISKAKDQKPQEKLEVRNFLTQPFPENSFDYVVSSQVLNLNIEGMDNKELAKKFLKEALSIAKKGVAIDFTTNYVDFKEDYLYYHSPEELFTYAKSLTKRVSLIHSYEAYEFTLYLYNDFQPWSKS
jgi:ubiquinone/menaquinone biosynthesis C-methylase UbiE